MGKIGLYCKAYPIERFQEFSKWQEQAKAIPPLVNPESGQETAQAEENILYGRFLFSQENFTVTQSIFLDNRSFSISDRRLEGLLSECPRV